MMLVPILLVLLPYFDVSSPGMRVDTRPHLDGNGNMQAGSAQHAHGLRAVILLPLVVEVSPPTSQGRRRHHEATLMEDIHPSLERERDFSVDDIGRFHVFLPLTPRKNARLVCHEWSQQH